MQIQGQTSLVPADHVIYNTSNRGITTDQMLTLSRRTSCVICGLSITQIVLGALTLLLGVAAIPGTSLIYWVSQTGSGVWFGIWIIITGIVGVVSTRQSDNRCLGKTDLAFNIVCSVFSILILISYAIAIWFFTHCHKREEVFNMYYYIGDRGCENKPVGLVLYSLLLVFMVMEFCISLSISIYCCKSMNYCKGSCCDGSPSEKYSQPVNQHNQPRQQVLMTNNGYHLYNGAFLPYNVNNTVYQPSIIPSQMVNSQPGANLRNIYTAQPQTQQSQSDIASTPVVMINQHSSSVVN